MVSIRILQAIGPQYAQDYITRFGFDADKHPPYLTMALGAGSVTPWQMARRTRCSPTAATASSLTSSHASSTTGATSWRRPSRPWPATESLRVIDARNAFLMDSMMHDVVRYGTAARAMSLGRHDLAGKTGTTNDYIDAWFSGYQPELVGIAWVGFDQPRKLGSSETGEPAALPIWIGYMDKALKNIAESSMAVPEGVTTARVNEAGQLAPDGKPEYFYPENLPPPHAEGGGRSPEEVRNQLF